MNPSITSAVRHIGLTIVIVLALVLSPAPVAVAAPPGAELATASMDLAAGRAAGSDVMPADDGDHDRDSDDRDSDDDSVANTGNRNNVVHASNSTNDRRLFRWHVQINRIADETVNAENLAIAESLDCTGCETYAVAVQFNIVSEHTTNAIPKNVAVAANVNCQSCDSFARAHQSTFSVPDTTAPISKNLLKRLDKLTDRLRAIAKNRNLSFAEATAETNSVVSKFEMLANDIKVDLRAGGSDQENDSDSG